MAMLMRRFEEPQAVGEQHAQNQRGRELQPVVCVKLDFRQDVRQGDAQEHAGREAKRQSDHGMLVFYQLLDAQTEGERAGDAGRRESQVRQLSGLS